MNDVDVKSIQRVGVFVIIMLILNFWMLHRKEDAVREFGMYFQGVVTGGALSRPSSYIPDPSPFQTTYEN